MNMKALLLASVITVALAFAPQSRAQTTPVNEDFTGTASENSWFFFGGACLTAGTNTTTTSPGPVPACTSVLQSYYHTASNADPYLLGGYLGYLGSSTAPSSYTTQVADPSGNGALRFTNGHPYGYNERGAIVFAGTPFPTNAGVQITFKTVTYGGDSGGSGGDGADGISFYLLDGCAPLTGGTPGTASGVPTDASPPCYSVSTQTFTNPIYGTLTNNVPNQTFSAIGAFGGSLAYSCSNSNSPHDGLVGAYLGLGIDEFGNFLNGWVNTIGETGGTGTSGDTTTYHDNTASGGLYQPGRIGLRGAGSISWQALNTAYGTSSATGSPYYPSSLSGACTSGTLYNGSCYSCSSGTLSTSGTSAGSCVDICTNTNGSGYNTSGTNAGLCSVCTTGTYSTAHTVAKPCGSCAGNYAFSATNGTCTKTSGSGPNTETPTWSAQTTANPTTATAGTASTSDLRETAVQLTCETGNLYNWSTPGAPAPVGAASLSNTANTAGILDYTAIGSTTGSSAYGYYVMPSGYPIAAESATTRAGATPIQYNLKITQDGLLTLSFSYDGGTATPVITSQSIIASNGQLPSTFRFGFAGSTGGDTNIHEIMCFKAQPVQSANGSGGVNVFQDPTLKTGAQFFLASYFPADWTGQLTATQIYFNTSTNPATGQPYDTISLATTPTWDASCVLTGGTCASTGATGMSAEAPTSRVMLTWNGSTGIPFEWSGSNGGLTTREQQTIDAGDTTPINGNRVNYLRGDRTNEINSSGVGLFRVRDRVLADIIDSSPTWVGPPAEPYTIMNSWVDDLYPSATPAENSGQSYVTYQQNNQGRLNVVYVGANDGFLHGFRAGSLDANGNLVANTSTPNDGQEVLAYMPSVVLSTIHPSTTTAGVTTVNVASDYANTQYSHAYFVDATPATGDLFYYNSSCTGGVACWHTWVVGGLGAGGADIYALDVTTPANFAEANASSIVVGDWTASSLTCVNNSSLPAPCAQALGNTYGTPEIRRFHNGDWGVIFGNGYGALSPSPNNYNGAAGIFIMLVKTADGTISFYYLPAAAAASGALPNGIGSPTSLDVDSDHIIDYIYAGDLLGNVWKFDVTSQNPANWGVTTSSPLFTAPYTPAVAASGGNPAIPTAPSPITTRLQVGTLKPIPPLTSSPERIIINFGTGRVIPQTQTSAAIYANGPQYLYGIWDWDFTAWNAISSVQQAVALTGPQTIVGPGSGTNLQVQTMTTTTTGSGATATSERTMSQNVVCWQGDTACGGGASQTMMGWYVQLPGTDEQVIFDPTYTPDGEFVVNTFIPSPSTVLSCSVTNATGFSMGLNPLTGGGSPSPFFNVGGVGYDGIQLNGTGTPSFLSSGQAADSNAEYMLTQTSSGTPAPPQKVNRNAIITGQRINWVEKR
jgi:type IV pilus assembly protein PilY1